MAVFGINSPGHEPLAPPIEDGSGNLFGTTQGSVFELSPPAAGHTLWHDTNLGYAENPGLVVASPAGTVYGVSKQGGTDNLGEIIEFLPPGTGGHKVWTHKTLYSFRGGRDGAYPRAGLAIDSAGAIYGLTDDDPFTSAPFGCLFRITP